jgi:hypothetical protein
MRLIVRSTSYYPAGSVRVEFNGSHPSLTERLLNVPAIVQAAGKAGFPDGFNHNGPEIYYSSRDRNLSFKSGGKVDPTKFIQTVSQIVTAKAGQHEDGDVLFVDQQEFPIGDDLESPTVDFLTLKVGLNANDYWYITVKDWRNGLNPVLHLHNSRWDLREAGFDPQYGNDLLVCARSRVSGKAHGAARKQALVTEASQIAGLVGPHLRVREPKKCQVEYYYGE